MTPKELKRLSRTDLLGMLLDLSKENDTLRTETETLRKQLEDRTIATQNCGSLAEAALQLNGIFQAAEAACAQYTENIQARSANLEEHCRRMEQETEERCRRMEQETEERCRRMEQETGERCHRMGQETEERCRQMDQQTEERCRKAEQKTREKCETLIQQTQAKAKAFVEAAKKQREDQEKEYLWLKELMNGGEAE